MNESTLLLLEAGEIALVIGAAFVAAFVSGIGGFGGAFILAAALVPIVGPKAVVPLVAVYALFSNIGRLYYFRRTIHWRFAVQFVVASLPGLAVGVSFLKWVPEDILLALFGVVLLSAIPVRRMLQRARFTPSWRTTAVIGFIFGAVSGTVVGSGMFVIASLNTFGVHGPLLMGTDAAIGITNALVRAIVFWRLGLLDATIAVAGVAVGVVSLPATWLASRVVKRLGNKRHSIFIEIIIVLAGVSFLLGALSKLL